MGGHHEAQGMNAINTFSILPVYCNPFFNSGKDIEGAVFKARYIGTHNMPEVCCNAANCGYYTLYINHEGQPLPNTDCSGGLDSRHFCSSLPRHRGVRLNRLQTRAAND